MLEEYGTLPLGIIHDGAVRRRYCLRPPRVRDAMAVRRSEDYVRCRDDDELMGLALLARRLRIDGLPDQAMTLAMMEDLFDEDIAEIMAAERRLGEQLARFRREGAQTTHSGPAPLKDPVGDCPEDGRDGSPGVAGGVDGNQRAAPGRAEDLPGAP
ncbi:MAG: hypothetical protein M0036_04935 [Desulfobacteraceae bacterium]|nr:hypothetical protein [Desulfobacteraceae bacterium]